MRRFLTRRWLASHIFVVALIVGFIFAGFWQLDRLGQRQDLNRRVEARMGQTAIALGDLVGVDPDDVEYRIIEATGTYLPAEIYVANRSDDGLPGSWAWTSFRSDDGVDILVNRGFIDRPIMEGSPDAPPLGDTAPPSGTVTVTGRIRRGIDDGRISEDRTEIARPDAALAARTLGLTQKLDPQTYLELIDQEPATDSNVPRPLPEPDLGEGPHRGYAVQWFTFAVIGAIGYLLVLHRIRRGDQTRGDVPHRLD